MAERNSLRKEYLDNVIKYMEQAQRSTSLEQNLSGDRWCIGTAKCSLNRSNLKLMLTRLPRESLGCESLLWLAVNNKDNVSLTKALLETDTQGVHSLWHDGRTLLHQAVSKPCTEELVLLLLKAGVSPVARDHQGRNALHHLTVGEGADNLEVARILLDRGVSLEEVQLCNGYTPLHIALFRGNVNLARLFLEYNANWDAKAKGNMTPLYLAAKHTYVEDGILQMLLCRGAQLEFKNDFGRTPLHGACMAHRADNVRFLVMAGADITSRDNDGRTPLRMIEDLESVGHLLRYMVSRVVLRAATKRVGIDPADLAFMHTSDRLRNFYNLFNGEIERMGEQVLHGSVTYLDILVRSPGNLARLAKNPKLVSAYTRNVSQLNSFPLYARELKEAFNSAMQTKIAIGEAEKIVESVFRHILPDVVIRNILMYMFP